MTNESEKARWAKLAGLPKKETKQQLDENVVGIGAVNQIFPTREPNDYEMAFEHFLGEMYDSKKDKVEEEEMSDAEKEKVDREVDAVRDDLDQISKLAKDAGEDAEDIKDMVDENLNEGNLDDLQKLNDNLSNALKAFKKKVEELKLGVNFGDVTQAVNKYTQDVFKANSERTGGKVDEVGFGKGSADGTEGFGDMLYKGMDESKTK